MNEVQCPGCNEQVYPVKHLSQNGGKKLSCPRCQVALPMNILEAPVFAIARPIKPAPVVAHPTADASVPLDPEAMLRARLEYIDARLAEVEPLRDERVKLQRMLDAAAPPSAKRATG